MLKLSLEEFIEEIEIEMSGYEEITKDHIDKWLGTFKKFTDAKQKSAYLDYTPKGIKVKLKDETDLFLMVDKYLAAVVNDELSAYFENWQL